MTLPKGTGLVADIGDPAAPGPLVALRADLDALPISDEKNVPYRSTVPNACHACGHDVHTTILLGARAWPGGRRLTGWAAGVRLIFQPARDPAARLTCSRRAVSPRSTASSPCTATRGLTSGRSAPEAARSPRRATR